MSALASVLVLAGAPRARAQDEEAAGGARGGYAWGEAGSRAEPDDPLRIMAFLGVGVGLRPLINLDFSQDLGTPGFMDFAAAVILPGGDLRHGAGLALTMGLADDGGRTGVTAFQQWVLTPSYHLFVPLRRLMPDLVHDYLQIHGRIGLPLVFSTDLGGTHFTAGLEAALALSVKFLAGIGAYGELTAAGYAGTNDTVHPVLSAELGLFFDYEVLP